MVGNYVNLNGFVLFIFVVFVVVFVMVLVFIRGGGKGL